MAELSREELKRKFHNGALAKEQNFADLIDSFVHKSGDNLKTGLESGLGLIPSNRKFLSFFRNDLDLQKNAPSFSFEATDDQSGAQGISLVAPGTGNCSNLITFRSGIDLNGNGKANGRVGINTSSPALDLDVNGSIGMRSRVGRFNDPAIDPRQIIADGKWHKVLSNLKGLTAIEVMTAVYCPAGKHALYYTILTNAFGKGCKVRAIQQSHSSWWHRIQMRWTKTTNGQYGLEVRTACTYKTKPVIYNRITKLWN